MPNIIKFINLRHYHIALKQEKDGNFDEALFELQNSISTIGDYSSLPYYEIAKLYYKSKDYNKSLIYIQKAIAIKKEIYYLQLLADNYETLHQFNKLKTIIEELLRNSPNDVKLLYNKALIEKETNLNQAQKTLFKLLQIQPDYKPANLLMAEILRKMGKKELAKYYRGIVNGTNK